MADSYPNNKYPGVYAGEPRTITHIDPNAISIPCGDACAKRPDNGNHPATRYVLGPNRPD